MSGFEFAVPLAALGGGQPRVMVWQDGEFIRITVQPAVETPISPVLTVDASLVPGTATGRGGPGGEWSSDGVVLPEYTELRFSYDGEDYEGTVTDGMLAFGDEVRHKSPSGAMMAAIRDRTGRSVNVNGWNYMNILLPGAKSWMTLGQMRSTVKRRG